MSVELCQTTHVYEVVIGDKYYYVHTDTDLNIGYTDVSITLEGEPVEGEEAESVLEYFYANVTKKEEK